MPWHGVFLANYSATLASSSRRYGMPDDRSLEARIEFLENTLGVRHGRCLEGDSWKYRLSDLMRRLDRIDDNKRRNQERLEDILMFLMVASAVLFPIVVGAIARR